MPNVTATEMYDSLSKISDIVNRALRDMGRIEGKDQSSEALNHLALDISKKIVQALPTEILENDELTDISSKFTTTMNRMVSE